MAVRVEIQNIMCATIQLLWELWMYSKEGNRAKLTEFEQVNTVTVMVTVKRGGITEKGKHEWEMLCRTGVSMRKSKRIHIPANLNTY